ncbi:Uncharacterised protein [Slackia heliotrinireducens]|uniref:Predicted ATPase (AAA+ superfamily) n=1 Tax=Slackia heliotrinireducens (strain ATCC 29202 / DSM 20476 / NCTC 11029 / RHS 1) TaxID=471855 RepID=C7N2C5_SLAHD|nr:DUF4143 domain-containing protein [Slackia heliotrinireducens]ACV21431.1 predicted ATPase (AAA+ superfamily) [Slackia heliotrinireducens DSM 20476]VEG98868.1 Uncharacterised protein [Slackia heliotrinireducens]
MRRYAEKELEEWLRAKPRKPLIVNGARQVGKTWLVTDFATRHFDSVAHVVFLDNEEAQRVFDGSLDANRLLMLIGALTGTNPRDGKTLVFLDEIQECPRAITALKLFCEQTPGIPIVAAGSLLGVALNRRRDGEQPASWPVGKVSYLDLFPMTFDEFVVAANPQLAEVLEEDDPTLADMVSERLTELLKTYMFVGGMPEAVAAFMETNDPSAARRVQSDLLRSYELDFSKHVESPLMTERIRETWRSVPSQLATESDMKRFTYAAIKSGARGRDYRDAVSWLVDAGLITRVPRVSKPGIPLEGYADNVYFKLYMLDVGLLGAATRLDAHVLLEGDRHFTEYKGAYAEQFVCQHLQAYDGRAPYYWSADGKNAKGEIDFLVERNGRVLPIEVKAAKNVSGESLANFCRANGLDKALRLSLLGYKDQGWLANVPLYSIPRLRQHR